MNQTEAACVSLHHTRTGRIRSRELVFSPRDSKPVTVSVCLSFSLSLSHTEVDCLPVQSSAWKPGLVHGAGRTQGSWQAGGHGHFSDFREKTPLSLVEYSFKGPMLLVTISTRVGSALTVPSPVRTDFSVYTRSGRPQA